MVVKRIEENWNECEGGPTIDQVEEGPMGMWSILMDGKYKLMNYYKYEEMNRYEVEELLFELVMQKKLFE